MKFALFTGGSPSFTTSPHLTSREPRTVSGTSSPDAGAAIIRLRALFLRTIKGTLGMRSISKYAYVLVITFAILFATSTPGSDDTALANAASGHRSRRANKKSGRDKKSSRRAGRGGTRGRDRSAGRGRRPGRYGRSRRGRQSVAQDSSPGGRQVSAGIPSERVTEIQKALIKMGYLEGPPSGQYDDGTVEAMKQFQSANQLPATGLPSAHSLKRLGVSKRSSDGYAVPVKSGQSDGRDRSPAND